MTDKWSAVRRRALATRTGMQKVVDGEGLAFVSGVLELRGLDVLALAGQTLRRAVARIPGSGVWTIGGPVKWDAPALSTLTHKS